MWGALNVVGRPSRMPPYSTALEGRRTGAKAHRTGLSAAEGPARAGGNWHALLKIGGASFVDRGTNIAFGVWIVTLRCVSLMACRSGVKNVWHGQALTAGEWQKRGASHP